MHSTISNEKWRQPNSDVTIIDIFKNYSYNIALKLRE